MRKIFILLNLFGLLFAANRISAQTDIDLDIPVKVVEVKDLGLSDLDESKSVIEIRWQIDPLQKEKISSFILVLSITYADGTTIKENWDIEKHLRSARVEVPSVKIVKRRALAFIKNVRAEVIAVTSEN